MEWQFCINWPALIDEAKQRRKTQRLTQSHLAKMAGISTPTISRFENGEKDIQLSTVMRIFTVLGMCDSRYLTFSKRNEYDDPRRMAVVFTGQDGTQCIQCAIHYEALADCFQGAGKDPLKVFQANVEAIQHQAQRKYLAANFEADHSIVLNTIDMG